MPTPRISKLESAFATDVMGHGSIPVTEYWAGGEQGQLRFAPPRRWCFDFAWPDRMVAVEVHGGIYARKGARKCPACGQIPKGGHSTPSGQISDMMKMNHATKIGWDVYAISKSMIADGSALEFISEVFEGKNEAQQKRE